MGFSRPAHLVEFGIVLLQRLTQSHGELHLTEEEKRTLVSEGYSVPDKLPLTKGEEKALKKVGRRFACALQLPNALVLIRLGRRAVLAVNGRLQRASIKASAMNYLLPPI